MECQEGSEDATDDKSLNQSISESNCSFESESEEVKPDGSLKPTFKNVHQAKKRLRAFSSNDKLKDFYAKEEKAEDKNTHRDKVVKKAKSKGKYDDYARSVIEEIEFEKRIGAVPAINSLPMHVVESTETLALLARSKAVLESYQANKDTAKDDENCLSPILDNMNVPQFKKRDIKINKNNLRNNSLSFVMERTPSPEFVKEKEPKSQVVYPKNWAEFKELKLSHEKHMRLKSKCFKKNNEPFDISHYYNFETPTRLIEPYKYKCENNHELQVPFFHIRCTGAQPKLHYNVNWIKNAESFITKQELYRMIPKERMEIIEKLPTKRKKATSAPMTTRQWYPKNWKKGDHLVSKVLEKSVGLSFLQTYSDDEENEEEEFDKEEEIEKELPETVVGEPDLAKTLKEIEELEKQLKKAKELNAEEDLKIEKASKKKKNKEETETHTKKKKSKSKSKKLKDSSSESNKKKKRKRKPSKKSDKKKSKKSKKRKASSSPSPEREDKKSKKKKKKHSSEDKKPKSETVEDQNEAIEEPPAKKARRNRWAEAEEPTRDKICDEDYMLKEYEYQVALEEKQTKICEEETSNMNLTPEIVRPISEDIEPEVKVKSQPRDLREKLDKKRQEEEERKMIEEREKKGEKPRRSRSDSNEKCSKKNDELESSFKKPREERLRKEHRVNEEIEESYRQCEERQKRRHKMHEEIEDSFGKHEEYYRREHFYEENRRHVSYKEECDFHREDTIMKNEDRTHKSRKYNKDVTNEDEAYEKNKKDRESEHSRHKRKEDVHYFEDTDMKSEDRKKHKKKSRSKEEKEQHTHRQKHDRFEEIDYLHNVTIKEEPDWENLKNKRKRKKSLEERKEDTSIDEDIEEFPLEKEFIMPLESIKKEKIKDIPKDESCTSQKQERTTEDIKEEIAKEAFPSLNTSWESEEEEIEIPKESRDDRKDPLPITFDLEIPLNIKPFKRRETKIFDTDRELEELRSRSRTLSEERRKLEIEKMRVKELELELIREGFSRPNVNEKFNWDEEFEVVKKPARWDKRYVVEKIDLTKDKKVKVADTSVKLENEYEEFMKAVTSSKEDDKTFKRKESTISISSDSDSFEILTPIKKGSRLVQSPHNVVKNLDDLLPKNVANIPLPMETEVKETVIQSVTNVTTSNENIMKCSTPIIEHVEKSSVQNIVPPLPKIESIQVPPIFEHIDKNTVQNILPPLPKIENSVPIPIITDISLDKIKNDKNITNIPLIHTEKSTILNENISKPILNEEIKPVPVPSPKILDVPNPMLNFSLSTNITQNITVNLSPSIAKISSNVESTPSIVETTSSPKSTNITENLKDTKPFVFHLPKKQLIDNSNLNLDDSDNDEQAKQEEIKRKKLEALIQENQQEKNSTTEIKNEIIKKDDAKPVISKEKSEKNVKKSHSRSRSSPRRKNRTPSPRRRNLSPRQHRSSPRRRHRSPSPRRRSSPRRKRSKSPRRRRSVTPKKNASSRKNRSISPKVSKIKERSKSPKKTHINVPDSTISDDLLDVKMSEKAILSEQTMARYDSPKRIPLDVRINEVLGISSQNVQNEVQNVHKRVENDMNYAQNYQQSMYIPTVTGVYNIPMPPVVVPPPMTPQRQKPLPQNIVQVGNIMEINPTLDFSSNEVQNQGMGCRMEVPMQISPQQVSRISPKPPVKDTTRAFKQVGNVLQIVPTEHFPRQNMSVQHPSSVISSVMSQNLIDVELKSEIPEVVMQDAISPPENVKQKVTERRVERENRRLEREQRRKEKERRRKEREKRHQQKLKIRTENLIKKALELEETEDTPVPEATNIEAPAQWPPVNFVVVHNSSKEVGKGILVKGKNRKEDVDYVPERKTKTVLFADGIKPGEGTSSSAGEELASPPPKRKKLPKEKRYQKKKVKVKILRKALKEEESDDEDSLPPPPPPPGSPPPHLWPPRIKPQPVQPQLQPAFIAGIPQYQTLYRPPISIIMAPPPPPRPSVGPPTPQLSLPPGLAPPPPPPYGYQAPMVPGVVGMHHHGHHHQPPPPPPLPGAPGMVRGHSQHSPFSHHRF